MPKNKFQEVIFTIIMVFVMVYAMICYNLVLAISAVSVAFMCPCMSFAATVLIKHAPASQIIPTWLQTTAMNFPMAFFWQIFYAGPFVRFIFGKLFPEKEKAAASAE